MNPRISVIVPTHNRRALLLRLLESLLRQTLPSGDYEIIVVCDGATDSSAEAARALGRTHPQLRLIEQPRRGPAAARNAGARLARGAVLAFTDDDCVASAGWLEQLVASFERSGAVAIEGRTTTDRSRRTPLTHELESEGRSGFMPTCNAACRREAFERVGGFAPGFPFPHNEDADLAWRLESLGPIGYAPLAHILHPPRPETFSKKAGWVRYLQSEFLLFSRNPAAYRKYASVSPWWTIYWKVFVVGQLRLAKSCGRYLLKPFRPQLFVLGVGVVAARWFNLIRFFPSYCRAHRRAAGRVRAGGRS